MTTEQKSAGGSPAKKPAEKKKKLRRDIWGGNASPKARKAFGKYLKSPKNRFRSKPKLEHLSGAMFAWTVLIPSAMQRYMISCMVDGQKYDPEVGRATQEECRRVLKRWPYLDQD